MANGEQGVDGGGLPKHTTPTWEVELLISGVAVFAMLQLPGWLDDRVHAFAPRLDATWSGLAMVLYLYAKSAALILGITFVLHLLLRARWIALVGMHSVHPDGIRWERLRMGPTQRKVETRLDRGSEVAIESADNGATTVFSIGVMLASMLAIIACIFGAGSCVLTLVLQAFGIHGNPPLVLLAALAIAMVPFSAAMLVDRTWGARLAPGGRIERLLAATLGFYVRVGLGRGRNRVHALLGSHHGDMRITAITVSIMAAVLVGVIFWDDAAKDPSRVGNYGLFPAAGADATVVDSGHYDDQRDPARDAVAPYIQGMVVAGPYLRVVVPFDPRRDGPALLAACPAAAAGTAGPGTLACLQRMHAMSLDGKPLSGSLYAIGDDPRAERPALLAMIDVRALAPGRHELRIAQPRLPGDHDGHDASDAADADAVVRIPFWR